MLRMSIYRAFSIPTQLCYGLFAGECSAYFIGQPNCLRLFPSLIETLPLLRLMIARVWRAWGQAANLVGFVLGIDGVHAFVFQLASPSGAVFVAATLLCFFSASQVSSLFVSLAG